MPEKKTRKSVKKATASTASDQEMKKRFGAMAYVETAPPEDEHDEGSAILSLDSLREAFASLEVEDQKLAQTAPDLFPEGSEKSDPENESDEPEYDEDFATDGTLPNDLWTGSDTEIPVEAEDDKAIELSPQTILEAMLFVGDRENKPLTPQRAAEKMRNVTPEEIDAAVDVLNQNYGRLGCPYMIAAEKDGYRMILRPEFDLVLAKFYGKIREATLSQQAIDTLAVVAYRQPITADDVQKIRRQPSSAILSQLVRRGLLDVERETQGKKKVMLYRTTERFLELFQLESIDDLPVMEELDFR